MVYFLITGLFLLPFVLNTSQGLLEKKNKWLHPLFFTISVMAILQIGLSWIPLFEIRNYFLFEALTIAILLVVVIALLSYFCFLISINKDKITFSNLVKFNRSSLIITAILLVQLVSLIFLPELSNFSDTTAYMSISSNFKINGNYFFNHSDNLPVFYRLPSGYFINSVIAPNNDFKTPYKILWPMLTVNLFYWTLNYYTFEKYHNWKSKYKLLFTAFATICYLILSYVALFTFSSGNLEIQSLFILIAFFLFLTNKGAHSIILVFAFSLFSSTALLISPPIIIVTIFYLIINGRRSEFLYALVESSSLFFLALSIVMYTRDTAVAFVSIGLSVTLLPVGLGVIKLVQKTYHILDAPLFHSLGLNAYKIKYKISNLVDGAHKDKKNRNILSIAAFFIVYIATALTTYYLTFALYTINQALIYVGAILAGIIGIYSIYSLIKKNRVPDLVPWIIFFNLAYIITCVILIPTNLFNSNASSWRMALSTVLIGFYCVYVGLMASLIMTMYNDHINFWQNLFKSVSIKRMRFAYVSNYLLSGLTIAGLISASSLVWISRTKEINNIVNHETDKNRTWSLTKNDHKILKTLNYYNDTEIKDINLNQTTDIYQKPDSFLFSYYSDVELSAYLNNCFSFAYAEPWSANFMNDFISTDAWVHVVQGRPINELLYFDVENTITNVNYIIEQMITEPEKNLVFSNSSSEYNKRMGIFVSDKDETTELNKPIKSDRIMVSGTPDLIILNNASRYYNDLKIVQETSVSTDNTYRIGERGYKLLQQSENTTYFGTIEKNWDKLLSLNLNQNGVNQ